MTLEEAKQSVSMRVEGYKNFNRLFGRYEPEHVSKLMDEAAEIYAKSKWDEACKEQLIIANKHAMLFHNHVLLEVMKPEFKP